MRPSNSAAFALGGALVDSTPAESPEIREQIAPVRSADPEPGYKVSFVPNPNRRHTRGRRGRAPTFEGGPEYQLRKEDTHSGKVQGAGRSKSRQEAASAKQFRERGLTGLARKRVQKVPVPERAQAAAKAANTARARREGLRSKQFRKMKSDVFSPKPAPKEAEPESSARREKRKPTPRKERKRGGKPAPEVQAPAASSSQKPDYSFVSLFKRAGTTIPWSVRRNVGQVGGVKAVKAEMLRIRHIAESQLQLLETCPTCDARTKERIRKELLRTIEQNPGPKIIKVESRPPINPMWRRLYEGGGRNRMAATLGVLGWFLCNKCAPDIQLPKDIVFTRHMIETMLRAGGIEPNPGPRTKGPEEAGSSSEPKRGTPLTFSRPQKWGDPKPGRPAGVLPDLAPKKPPGNKHAKSTLLKLVETQLEEAVAQREAAADIEADLKSEEQEAREELAAAHALAVARSVPHEVCFHPFGPRDDLSWQDCATNAENLRFNPMPHRVARATRVDDEVVNVPEDRRPPHEMLNKCPPGQYTQLVYEVRIYDFSFLNHYVSENPSTIERVVISTEQLMLALSRRIGQFCTFPQAVERVRSFRAAKADVKGSSTWDEYGELNDQVFAALIQLRLNGMSNSFFLELAMAQGFDVLRRHVLADTEEAMVAGTYVRGYEVGLRDLFAPIMDDAASAYAKARNAVERSGIVRSCTDKLVAPLTGINLKTPLEDAARRAREYCRMLPGHIRGLFPTFPNPYSATNIVVSGVKRLLRPVEAADAEAVAREREMAAEVIERVQRHRLTVSDDEILECSLLKASSEPWSDIQRECFLEGARCFLQSPLPELGDYMKTISLFIKQESYDPTVVKAARFIAAPKHFVRGMMFAACEHAEEAVVHAFGAHLVKGLTSLDMRAKLMSAFQSCSHVFESDYGSFESLITQRRQQEIEIPVLVAAAPSHLAGRTEYLLMTLSSQGCVGDLGRWFRAFLPVLRRSGDHHTSVGNAVENICMSFAAMSRAAGVKVEGVRKWFREWKHPWMVEGDDGVFELHDIPHQEVEKCHKLAGNRVESDVHRQIQDASFCGARLLADGGIWKDPLSLLANMTSWMGCDRTSSHSDEAMLVAKAMSYGLLYHHLPLIGPACRTILMNHRGAADALVALYERDPQNKHPAVAYLRDFIKAKHLSISPSLMMNPLVETTVRDFAWWKVRDAVLATKEISADAREACAEMWRDLTAEAQERAEHMYHEAVTTKREVIIPTLEQAWGRCKAVNRMVIETFQGKRERAEQLAEHLTQPVLKAAERIANPSFRDKMKLVSGLANLLVASSTIALLVAVVKAVWLVLSLVGAGVLLTAVLFCAVWFFLGVHPRWALRGVRAVSWTFLGVLSLCWLKWLWGRQGGPAAPSAAAARPGAAASSSSRGKVSSSSPPPPPPPPPSPAGGAPTKKRWFFK